MRYLSLFAGVGGFDLGADAAGWECAGQVECDQHASAVLARHWPNVPRWGDVRDFHGGDCPADVVAGGFPCQDVSVAGKRAGLDGTRSGLYAEIIRIVKEMRDATENRFPRWVVVENVVGLLSIDGGAGFGQVLDDLADLGALVVEWAVLDAQHFGVPQRRRRVFVVACFDPAVAARCPDPLLPVATRLPGNPRPGRTAGQDVASTLGGGSGSRGRSSDTDRMTFVPVANPLTARDGKGRPTRLDAGEGNVVVVAIQDGREIAKGQNGLGVGELNGPAYTLDTTGAQAVAVSQNQRGELRTADTMPSLSNGGGKPGQGYPAVAHPIASTSLARDEPPTPEMVVRRLTPVECERLMGWPDDHTRWHADGTEQADSHRYQQCGNGIVAPVARWVCEQINKADQADAA